MKATERARDSRQSLWIGHVTREEIYNGSLMQYIEDGWVTGLSLTSQAICNALSKSKIYDEAIGKKLGGNLYGESLALELLIEDIRRAADLLRYVSNRTDGIDGWATFPVSPLLTGPAGSSLESVFDLHARLKRTNTLITVPGSSDGLGTIEEIVFAGIPLNISLIYSSDQYLKAAEAYLHGVERRIAAGLNPAVSCFITISICDVEAALSKKMTQQAAIKASIAIARMIYKTMRTLHTSQQWERVYDTGARPLRLAWDVSGDNSNTVSNIALYNLMAPLTVQVVPSSVFEKFINSRQPETLMPVDGADCEDILSGYQKKAGVDFEKLAHCLQDEGEALQVNTWISLLDALAQKSADAKKNVIRNGNHRRTQKLPSV